MYTVYIYIYIRLHTYVRYIHVLKIVLKGLRGNPREDVENVLGTFFALKHIHRWSKNILLLRLLSCSQL